MKQLIKALLVLLLSVETAEVAMAQQVGLPAPRLLTTMPMGAQVGTQVEVTVTGENLDESTELLFSTPKLTAKPKMDASGKPEPNKFIVSVAEDASPGIHDARMMTQLGISSVRAFSISDLLELTRSKSNTSLDTAMELKLNSICNATITSRAVDYYSFVATSGRRVAVECAAPGIDSKLVPVLIIADSQGRDLIANRADGFIEFSPPADGTFVIKVHGLTFQGGAEYFYRLALMDAPVDEPVARHASTRRVSAFSWNASDHPENLAIDECEPNNAHSAAKRITLPCEVKGSFAKAADVDTFEFSAKKGEDWWIEVASERLGLPTDPFALVQRVVREGDKEELVDVVELNDIPSPMKVSSNGYSYDGPVYDAGSSDVLGRIRIEEDGVYRLQLRDLFGGTRNDPRNVYRLVVRKPAPDFALVAWAIHMELRNGDRAALSKPIALRGGSTMAFEVVAIRKDGFDGPIEIGMEELPRGISACGIRIPAGKNKGILLVSADENAEHAFASAKIVGSANIGGEFRTRTSQLASTVWPVRDASQEIPNPRLLADVPVSASGLEKAPLSIVPAENKLWEATEGETLKIPLKLTWRNEFSGSVRLKTFGDGFESTKIIDVPLNAPSVDAVLDLASLKTKAGDYAIAFYCGAVAKHQIKKGDSPKDLVDIVVSEPIRLKVNPVAGGAVSGKAN